jgi:hypothetical protein
VLSIKAEFEACCQANDFTFGELPELLTKLYLVKKKSLEVKA